MVCGSDHRDAVAAPPSQLGAEALLASKPVGENRRLSELSVPGIHCGGCIRSIETALAALPGVDEARVNLSTKRVRVLWHGTSPPPLIQTLRARGFDAHVSDFDNRREDSTLRRLITALAVAGFAASNIMLLSVSVWSGADATTRDLFHWIAAAIALPALAYSGRIFFESAWRALRYGRTNMDVPISVGILLAYGLSLYETATHGQHAYFDATVTLLFFLLIGRTLDHVMRARAHSAVTGLARLLPRGALVVAPDGKHTYLPVDRIEPGMTLILAAGERVPVDGLVVSGRSDVDCALITGESQPQPAETGTRLRSGTLNLTGSLTLTATSGASDSFLAELLRTMDGIASGRSPYRRIADRVAGFYAPVVHLAALLTFIGWMAVGADAYRAITIAIAVLIITCPCALGLAVPMVQVAAARRLFERGIIVRDGTALERLADVDTVVFDKTGTLTLGEPRLLAAADIPPETLAFASGLAAHSRHPYARAIAAAGDGPTLPRAFDSVTEHPGDGLEGHSGGRTFRLGRAAWALDGAHASVPGTDGVAFAQDGLPLAVFRFSDRLRADAYQAVSQLADAGLATEIVSGDSEDTTRSLALELGMAHAAQVMPVGKVDRIMEAATAGRKVLMVGDGLNDTPAIAAAHVSMAPASAADISRGAADFVFVRESLLAVPAAIAVARNARRLVRQNIALAIAYNMVALPVAVLGYVTPLVAAIAMSASSILVVLNSQRQGRMSLRRP